MIPFEPHPWLRNPHLMTIVGSYWPRRFPRLPRASDRLFEVEPGSWILARCHWQNHAEAHPVLALVHGLEGSSESQYMLGTAEKAFAADFSVLRLNQRNCGDTEHLTPTLYNSSLSGDYRAVLEELIGHDRLRQIFFAGFSMGGNLVLKMAGELGDAAPGELRGVAAVAPGLHLAACVDALAEPRNFLYQRHFVRSLKRRMRRKARLFPGRYALDGLARVSTLREFDNAITAPYSGFRDADDYYDRAGARHVAARIRVPTLILASQDDPIVPIASFRDPAIEGNPHIDLVTQLCGGHCGFISNRDGDERHWAEARLVEFFLQLSRPSLRSR